MFVSQSPETHAQKWMGKEMQAAWKKGVPGEEAAFYPAAWRLPGGGAAWTALRKVRRLQPVKDSVLKANR